MYLSMVCGMFVCVSLSINVCMFTVSNALLMSNATAMVRVGGMGWLLLVVVVRLPRPMEGNGVTPIFRSLQNCQFHHRRPES